MVFNYETYKDFLKDRLQTTGESRGIRSRLARHLNCQTSFISQALRETGNFSLEHLISIGEFLNLSEDERHFFMLLAQKDKAGSQELRRYYEKQISEIREKRSQVKERIKVEKGLSEKDHQTYYSQWYYSAVHIAVAIEGLQTKEAIIARLGLGPKVVSEVFVFLTEKGLVEEDQGFYKIGKARIHLDKNSPMIYKHHTNWRLQAIRALERQSPDDLHYSSILAISRDDALKIRDILLQALENIEPVVAPSKEEDLFSLCMDLFKI